MTEVDYYTAQTSRPTDAALMPPAACGIDQLGLLLASHLAPASLFDAMLLRRTGDKVRIGPLGESAYRVLFCQQCRATGIAFGEQVLHHLLRQLHGAGGRPLLASTPRKLLDRIADFAGFSGSEVQLTVATLGQAWSSLFAGCDAPDAVFEKSIA